MCQPRTWHALETVSTNRKHLTARVESCNTDRSIVLLHSDRSFSATLPPSVRTRFMDTEERQNFKCQSYTYCKGTWAWILKSALKNLAKRDSHICVFYVTNEMQLIWCKCDRASYIQVRRCTNLMQQFTMIFILINSLYMFRTFTCPSSGFLI